MSKSPVQAILAAFCISLIASAAPVGICLHAYGPDAPADKIECFEFVKTERTDSGTRYFMPNGISEIVTAYRERGVVWYPRNLPTDPEELARLQDVFTRRAQQSPSTRPFLNPWIARIQAIQAENAKREDRFSQMPSVTLADGKILKGCKIKRIEGSFVYLSYADGVKKVDVAQLSDATKKTLHFDTVPKEAVKSVEQVEREAKELADAERKLNEAKSPDLPGKAVHDTRGVGQQSGNAIGVGEMAELKKKAGECTRFVVVRKLDVEKFVGLQQYGHEMYQVSILYFMSDTQTGGILVTNETSYKSTGESMKWIRKVDEVQVELESGFESKLPVYQESPSECVKEFLALLASRRMKQKK